MRAPSALDSETLARISGQWKYGSTDAIPSPGSSRCMGMLPGVAPFRPTKASELPFGHCTAIPPIRSNVREHAFTPPDAHRTSAP